MPDFQEFFSAFGGALRTKNLVPVAEGGPGLRDWWQRLRRQGRYAEAERTRNRRPYNLPAHSALPREYIRLCPWEAEYLYLLAVKARLGIVETGRLFGGSTFMLGFANRTVPIYSIDINPQGDEQLRNYFALFELGGNVELITGDSQNVRYPHIGQADLLFIDGDHSYQGCTADLENWYPHLAPGGHIVLHDCYFGSPVQESVIDFMARHPEVSAVRSPYIHTHYWHLPTGSLAHLIRNAT